VVLSGLGKVVLAPVPVQAGSPVCLYPDNPIASSQWDIFNVLAESVASLSFNSPSDNCWNTTGVAPGLYFVRLKITYADGHSMTQWRKVIIK
jgi:hypothetical protein